MIRFLSPIAVSLALACSVSAEEVFHVSPEGNDAWSGRKASPTLFRKDGPFATLPAAVKAAREVRAKVGTPSIIRLASGRHELADTLVFGPEDSGLTIEAAKGATPLVSGGVRLTGWTRSTANPSVWETKLPAAFTEGAVIRQLFVNGERAIRARTPNEGFFRTRGPLGTTSPIEVPYRPGEMRPEWAGQGEFNMLMKWTSLQVPILGVDTMSNVFRVAGAARPYWMDEPDARFWIENVPDALDQPGEWFHDVKAGTVRYIPPAKLDPNKAVIVAPRLHSLIRWQGDAAKDLAVSNVTLRGLHFVDVDYDMPPEGRIDPQAASQTRGSLRAEFAVDCVIEDCRFSNLGGYGLELARGTQRWKVVGNEFRSLGAGGIRIGEMGDRTPTAFTACHSHAITDNHLHQLGRLMNPGIGIILFQTGTNRVAHNHIHDLYYTGISVGWNWGYQSTPCRENIIEFNHVHDVGQGRLSDMGGIYTLGPQPGTVIRNNLFHDITSYTYGGWGLYTDEGSTGILLENNVAFRCKDAGFHQHYGSSNVVRNNLLAFNRNHSVMRSRAEPHLSFWFTNNVVIADSGTLLGSNWQGTPTNYLMAGNVWFDTRSATNAAAHRFAGKTFEAWQKTGQDTGSLLADPLLKDPSRPQLGLKPESPAFKIGFKQIDMSTVGPRPKPARK